MKFVEGQNESNSEKNLPGLRFVHHEAHMVWPKHELGTPAMGGQRTFNNITANAIPLLRNGIK